MNDQTHSQRQPWCKTRIALISVAMLAVPWKASFAQPATMPDNYADNLALIKSATPRNTNHDNSPWRDTPQNNLVINNHLGARSDYLSSGLDLNSPPYYAGKEAPGATPERAFPDAGGGQFRVTCEFSHFAYDDPLVHPGKPGASHLHMFFGNTDVNAYSTYETLINSGSSTCNGQELNRTGYWMPALFDNEGNVRIPMRAIVYYKGYNNALGRSQPYPPGAAIIAMTNLHTVPASEGGVAVEDAYQCADQFRNGRSPQSNVMPVCPGGDVFMRTIELHVKFPNCWNGNDPSDTRNWRTSFAGDWYISECGDWITTPNIEYIVQYQVQEGENTQGWYLASDVDRASLDIEKVKGSTLHADWWGGWHPEINQLWLDNCTNYKVDGVPSGCGMGYLSDNGPDPDNPYPGPALKLRPQYDQPQNGAPKVAAATLYEQLCPDGKRMESPEDAAWCTSAEDTDEDGGSGDDPADDNPTDDEQPPVSDTDQPGLPTRPGRGLLGRYFDDPYYGNEVGRRLDGPVNINLNRRIPARSNLTDPDDVSIEWNGYLVIDQSETLQLWTRSDDGVRVYLDGELVIDNWTDHAPVIDSAQVSLDVGRAYAITVQYYQGKGLSRLQLGWLRSGDRRRLIPRRFLYEQYPYDAQ